MLAPGDIKGLCALPPTPCKEGAGGWDGTDSVDLDTTADMVERLIQAGVGMIGLCGTTGECAALLWEEKRDYVDTAVQVARGRVPIFAGATALGTKEVVRQMRGLREVGADGAFVGLPLWQTPTTENSVQFYTDLGEAVLDMPIMVYGNAMYFKTNFPVEFWEGLARRAATVVTAKVSYPIDHLLDDLRVAGHRINFMPGESHVYRAYKMAGKKVSAFWSTGAAMGPEPLVALAEAILRDDGQEVDRINAEIEALPRLNPPGQPFPGEFPMYNAQVAKHRVNVAGWIDCGPLRAPYRDLSEKWRQQAEVNARAWAELRKKYVRAAV